MQQQAASVFAVDCHPKKPQLSIGGSDGTLHIWNYETKEKLSELTVPDGHFTCLKYSPNGVSLGASYSNGTISFYDSESLQVII
jgi:WD40 repeat protein